MDFVGGFPSHSATVSVVFVDFAGSFSFVFEQVCLGYFRLGTVSFFFFYVQLLVT